MPLLTAVGRRRLPAITLLAAIYLLLTLGAVTMVVPAMIMLSASLSNEWDYDGYRLVPRWFWDSHQRHMKFISEKYLNLPTQFPRDFSLLASAYLVPTAGRSLRAMRESESFDVTTFLASERTPEQLARIHADYQSWLATCDPMLTLPMFARLTLPRYQAFLRQRYEALALQEDPSLAGVGRRELEAAALARMAERWKEARFTEFSAIEMSLEAAQPYHLRAWMPALDEARMQDYLDFVRTLPADWRVPVTEAHLWLRFLENTVGDARSLERRTGLRVQSLAQVRLPNAESQPAALAELGQEFLADHWPLWLVKLPESMAGEWREYLKQRSGSIERFNAMTQGRYRGFHEVPFTGSPPMGAMERNFWRDFLRQLPADVRIKHRVSAEASFREFLLRTYGSVDAINAAYGWQVRSLDPIHVPLAEVDRAQFAAEHRVWIGRFFLLNYLQVWDYISLHSRAIFNTVVLVALSILSTLTVNPLAAYALSRYPLRSGSKVLLFLLATMAFPAEVSMIPSFLLLREMNLLNTFAALILPGLANGFAIFLLKGFFDSLPRELYEAAAIDGAGEFTVFTRITLPLSGPILAYQSLMAFLGAYGGFMWAFLVCQDSQMWTLMVWIYQFQQAARSTPYTAMAAFVLASIPTLVVFVLCQRVILRGIVIPAMK